MFYFREPFYNHVYPIGILIDKVMIKEVWSQGLVIGKSIVLGLNFCSHKSNILG